MSDRRNLYRTAHLQPLPELLKNSFVLIGVSAIASVYITSMFLSLDPNMSWLLAPLVTVTVYGLNDLTDSEEDTVNQPRREVLARSSKPTLRMIVVITYISALSVSFLFGNLVAVAITALPGLSGVLYSIPCLPFSGTSRIKEVFVLNTVVVAGTWSLVMAYLPVVLAPRSVPAIAVALMALFWFLRFGVTVETCNVPDITGDRRHGVTTIPTKYGVHRTQQLLYSIDILSIGIIIAIGWIGTSSVPTVVVIPALAYSTVCTYLLRRDCCQQAICVASDAHIPLMAVLVFVVSLF